MHYLELNAGIIDLLEPILELEHGFNLGSQDPKETADLKHLAINVHYQTE